MNQKEIAKEEKMGRIEITILIIVGILFVGFIVYLIILTTSGKIDTHLERFRLCEEKGYDYMRYIKGAYANCCREILRSNGTYYLTEECIKLEIPK